MRKGSASAGRGGEPVDTATVFQIGSATKPFLATTMAIAADRGEVRLGRPGRRPRSRFPAEGSLGHARVPRLRPDGPALRAAALRQRHGGPPRRRPAGDDPLAPLRRAGVELPLDLRLHQHHPHSDAAHRGEAAWRRRLERGRTHRDLRAPRHEGFLPHRRSHRGGRQPRLRPPLDARRHSRSPVHAVLSLRIRRSRRDQFQCRRHGPLAPTPPRQRRLRGETPGHCGEPRLHSHAEGRGKPHDLLRHGLGHPGRRQTAGSSGTAARPTPLAPLPASSPTRMSAWSSSPTSPMSAFRTRLASGCSIGLWTTRRSTTSR